MCGDSRQLNWGQEILINLVSLKDSVIRADKRKEKSAYKSVYVDFPRGN